MLIAALVVARRADRAADRRPLVQPGGVPARAAAGCSGSRSASRSCSSPFFDLGPVDELVHVGTYLLAAAFLVVNRRVPGRLAGRARRRCPTALTITLNHGTLPARAAALRAAGPARQARPTSSTPACMAHAKLPWLGDVFAVPKGVPLANVFSVGDVLLVVGAFVVVHGAGPAYGPAAAGRAGRAGPAMRQNRLRASRVRTLPDPRPDVAPAGPRRIVLLGSTGSVGRAGHRRGVERRRTGSRSSPCPPAARTRKPLPPRRSGSAYPSSGWPGPTRRAAARGARCRRPARRARCPEIAGRAGRRRPSWPRWTATSCSTRITGSIGLAPTLAALAAGRLLALANKESLIVGGPLVTAAAAARPDRAGRLRALGARPVPARRPGRRGAAAGADRERRPVPRADPRALARRDARRRRWPTRPGTWARSSPPTRRRWSTRGSR